MEDGRKDDICGQSGRQAEQVSNTRQNGSLQYEQFSFRSGIIEREKQTWRTSLDNRPHCSIKVLVG